ASRKLHWTILENGGMTLSVFHKPRLAQHLGHRVLKLSLLFLLYTHTHTHTHTHSLSLLHTRTHTHTHIILSIPLHTSAFPSKRSTPHWKREHFKVPSSFQSVNC